MNSAGPHFIKRSFLSFHDLGSFQIGLVDSQDKRIFLHCLSDGGIVFLCFGKSHVPADGHDFLHGKPDVTLNQHDRFFAVAERALIIYLIGLYGLPDEITLCVVFDLPSFSAGYFFSIIGFLVFRSFDIKIGFAEIMKQAYDNEAVIGYFRQKRSPEGTVSPGGQAVIDIQAVLQKTAFTGQMKMNGCRSFVKIVERIYFISFGIPSRWTEPSRVSKRRMFSSIGAMVLFSL